MWIYLEVTETVVDASKEAGLEENIEKMKYGILVSCYQNAGQNLDMLIANRSFENVSQLKYLGITVKVHGFSLKANYMDWATATGRRILVPTFVDRGVSRGQRGGTSMTINLTFLYRSHYFFFQVAPHLCSWVWVNPVPDPLLRRKSVVL
jgi:hypothetical protein